VTQNARCLRGVGRFAWWSEARIAPRQLTALRSEQEALGHAPTWPWQPETLRSVIAAILLPLALCFIQWLLGRLLEH